MVKWYFPGGYDLTPTGSNGAGIENFLDDIPKSLTREVIQNSMDAHEEGNEHPTRVVFQFTRINAHDLAGIKMLKTEVLPQANTFWRAKNNEDTCAYLENFEKYLRNPMIPVLKISDYNTTGLNNNNFSSLVEGEGFSEKANEFSAGSKGIGKAAPFAASNLRIVFYNSKSNRDGNKFAGVINFVSFEDKEKRDSEHKFITQSRGRLLEENEPNCFREERHEFGTDVFVVSLKNRNDWEEKIILTVITDFLIAILKRQLEVSIGDYHINLETLPEIIERIRKTGYIRKWKLKSSDKKDFNNAYSYYLAMTSNDRFESFLPPEMVDKYPFIEDGEDAKLSLVLLEENSTRRVLQTRRSGMRIYERKNINGSIPFAGVFYAEGKKLNKFLRKLENVNHDQWSPDRVSDSEHEEAGLFLKDLFWWYRDEVLKWFGVEEEENISAFGMAELLPIQKDYAGQVDIDKDTDTGIGRKIKEADIKNVDSRGQLNDEDGMEKTIRKIIDEISVGAGNSSSSGSRRTGVGGGNSPGNNFGTGEEDGSGQEDADGEKIVGYTYKEVGIPQYLKMKVIETDAKQGQYRLVGIAKENKSRLAVEIRIVGENGNEQSKTVRRSGSGTNRVEVRDKKIIIYDIHKNNRFVIDFDINESFLLKMKGVVYEITG